MKEKKDSETKGIKHTFRTNEQRIEVAKQICDQYEIGEDTLESCCNAFGVARRTFHGWAQHWDEDPETIEPKDRIAIIANYYKKIDEKRNINIRALIKNQAIISLQKRVVGHTFDEVAIESKMRMDEKGEEKLTVVSKKVTTKEIQPSDTAIIFALKNLDPDNFKDVVVQDHKGGLRIVSDLQNLSDEDFEKLLAEKEKKVAEKVNKNSKD